MTIHEIIKTTTPIKVKHITYAKDGNTVVTHHELAYPIVDNFYVFKTKPDSYGLYSYTVVAVFSGNYAITFCTLSRYDENEETVFLCGKKAPLEENLKRIGFDCSSDDAFLAYLDRCAANHQHIQAAAIRLAEMILRDTSDDWRLRIDLYVASRAAYRAEQERKEREAEVKRQQEREREAQEQAKRWEERMEKMRMALLSDGTRIPADIDALFSIAVEADVTIPIKVKGWMRENLVTISIEDGRIVSFQYRKTPSKTFNRYLDSLIGTLRNTSD